VTVPGNPSPAAPDTTVPRAFLRTVARQPDAVALRALDRTGSWERWTWTDVAAQVARLSAELAARGIGSGDRVVLALRNRPEFHWLDLAAQFRRAVPVSLYRATNTGDPPEELRYLVGHTGARLAVVDDPRLAERLHDWSEDLPALREVVVLDAPGRHPAARTSTLTGEHRPPDDLAALAAATSPEDLATLVYTSGTTGLPKGVMLDQANVVATAEQLRRCLGTEDLTGWRVVSYLPMAHIAERMVGHYLWAIGGSEVTCCPDPDELGTVLREIRPQLLFGVPRIWERLRSRILDALDPERRDRLAEGVALARTITAAERAGTATDEQRANWSFLDAVAFAPLRQAIGLDDLRVAVSGAAPLTPELHAWFLAVGIPLSEIYGQSESCGPITWSPHEVRPGTVGRAIPECEVRLADDGEVCCRGPNVFRGYWHDEARTTDTLVDGWLHTGDIGVLDPDGLLRIVDRKKDLIVTSVGEHVSPASLEAALRTIPLVGQAVVVGDRRPFVAAVIALDPDAARRWATAHDCPDRTTTALAGEPALVDDVAAQIDELNERLAPPSRIRRFAIVAEDWDRTAGLLTPTAKLKRRAVAERYADVIDGLYGMVP
jgi:long-chain acyl-CoA synthetase